MKTHKYSTRYSRNSHQRPSLRQDGVASIPILTGNTIMKNNTTLNISQSHWKPRWLTAARTGLNHTVLYYRYALIYVKLITIASCKTTPELSKGLSTPVVAGNGDFVAVSGNFVAVFGNKCGRDLGLTLTRSSAEILQKKKSRKQMHLH